MTFSGDLGNWFDGHEHHAELLGASGEVVEQALAILVSASKAIMGSR
jgi:hypothetical protein